jgi:hypothetical protein
MRTLTLLLAAATLAASTAYAQPRGHREPYRTDHWVFDDRFHHNHYYPAPGYAVRTLPPGHLVIARGPNRFYYHAGVWWRPGPAGFVVVHPPIGLVIPVLPPAYTTVWIGGAPYYYADDVYYAAAPGGYAVAQPPMDATAQTAPPAAAPAPGGAPTGGNWYYCESSKTYYPYAQSCPEGWRSVPATPPPSQ